MSHSSVLLLRFPHYLTIKVLYTSTGIEFILSLHINIYDYIYLFLSRVYYNKLKFKMIYHRQTLDIIKT